ncbi:MAG TPA: hypothetical protein VKR60_13715 [Candidatus Sulfotelmatobacter sp.]|nr:hypothetical protein [Candidatus Sulfotelmatobacter sp.]
MCPADFQDPPSSPPDQPKDLNFVKEAFHLQYNVIALGAAGVFALVSGSLLPAILAGGLELMYLAIIPQNWRFQRLVRSWRFAEEQQKHQQQLSQMLRTLPSDMQSRYWKLGEVCNSIHNNFNQLSTTSQIFLQQMDGRLSGLLNGYTRLLLAAAQQQQYLRSTDQNEIKREVATLQKSLSTDPPRVQDINKKRIEILNKRLEKYDKLCENRKVVDAQCSAVEDVLHLIRDQSVTMRDPQQISDQLDNLVKDVEETEQTVQQVEAIFSDLTPDMEGIMSMDDTSTATSSAPNRTRIPN